MKKFLSVFLVIAALSLSACSSGKTSAQNSAVSTTNGLSPEQTAETAFKSLKNGDTKTFNKLTEYKNQKKGNILYADNKLSGDDLDKNDKEFIGLLFDKFSYKIVKTEQKNNTATVNVKITNSDFSNLDTAKYSDSDNPLLAAMENNGGKAVTKNVQLNLVKKDSEWKMQLDHSDLLILCGGLDPLSETLSTASETVSEVKGLL